MKIKCIGKTLAVIMLCTSANGSELQNHYVVAEDIGNAINKNKDCIKNAVAKHFNITRQTLDAMSFEEVMDEINRNIDTLPDINEKDKTQYIYLWEAAELCPTKD